MSFAWSTFELIGEQATAKSKPLSTTLGAAAAFLLAATECICRMEISFQGGQLGGSPPNSYNKKLGPGYDLTITIICKYFHTVQDLVHDTGY